ncbi:hypothetical protein T439DRAFT_323129 [Meredithblackwellia eburnea MCA 4105]
MATSLQLVAPIHSLPSELISTILEHSLQDTPHVRTRYSILKAYSLVCQDWKGPAQRLLYTDVYLYHETVSHLFLESEQTGKYHVNQLRLFGDLNWDGVENESAKDVVKVATGVETLALWYFEALDLSVLEAGSLSQLKTLIISSTVKDPCNTFAIHPLAFRLSTLSLQNFPYPGKLMSALFTACASNLTTLNLSSYGGTHHGSLDEAVLTSLHLVAPTVVELHMPPITNEECYPALLNFVSLKTLYTHETRIEFLYDTLAAIPSSLSFLSVRLPGRDIGVNYDFLKGFQDEALCALAELEKLEIQAGIDVADVTMMLMHLHPQLWEGWAQLGWKTVFR